MHWIIDRFENDHAFLIQGEKTRRVRLCDLPADAKEGDALVEVSDGYAPDPDWAAQKQAAAKARLRALLDREVR